MLAQYGVARDGLPGDWPTGYDDDANPYTPAWQEPITGVSASQVIRIAREFAHNAEESGGRSMIIMGAGICQWFHGDATYRAVLAMLMLTGSMGRNGGGWAHYVGQEKCRPITGWATMAMATDWVRPPRQMIGTGYWYAHTDQWRYDGYRADALTSPLGQGRFAGMHTMDVLASSVAMGWMPFFPQFDRNSLDVADEAAAAGVPARNTLREQLAAGELKLAVTDPDDPGNWPRVLTVWRANLLGSSSKGNEYFLQHLLGATRTNLRAEPGDVGLRPRDVAWTDEVPEGKLDLLLSIDFRMTSTTLLSDLVLPAATWYEKADLSSTDMHPYVHAFSPAIDPPWETRSDYDAFDTIARAFSRLAEKHLGVRTDVVMTPLQHDTPGETAYPGGVERDWRRTGEVPVPGKTMGQIAVVDRDYPALAEQVGEPRPAGGHAGPDHQGRHRASRRRRSRDLAARHGVMGSGAGAGRPAIDTDVKMADTILALSGTSNGRLAVEGFRQLEQRTGRPLVHLAEGSEERRITYADTQARPVPVITSPEWSGSETGGRRYAPFTVNVEELKPWHTLTGRMHFYLDHDWLRGTRRAAAGLPAAAGHGPAVRRTPDRFRHRGSRALRAVPDPALEVVDPLRVPGQPVHAVAVPRRADDVDEPGRRRQDRRRRQRLGRGGEPQRGDGVPRDRVAPDAGGHGVRVPRAGTHHRRAADRDHRQPRRHPQFADPAAGQAQPPGRRVRADVLRVQLSRSDRQPARRGDRGAPPISGGEVLMRVMAQLAMVMNLDKCIGCHTCSVTCKQAWTNRSGIEYVWFNNVETRPGQGLSAHLRGPGPVGGRLGPGQEGPAAAARRRPVQEAGDDLLQPEAALHRRLLRAVDLRLREPDERPARRAHAGGAAAQPDQRRADEGGVVGELGRRPRRQPGDPVRRPDSEEGQRAGQAGTRADLHVLPAADLRALPEPVLRGVLPVRGDVQARRGRHRAGRPGPVPRLADVRLRLPVQEGVLQPPHRQGREVHVLLPADRGRPAHGVLARPASAGCATSAWCSTTPTGCWRRRRWRTRPTCTRRSWT